MKRKPLFWGLISAGSILILLSFFLTFSDAAQRSIIGGADWPTVFYLYQTNYSILTFYGIVAILVAFGRPWKNSTLKSAVVLLLPYLLFPGLRSIYQWFNRTYLVHWLGCGCPDAGKPFNANDFSCIFWFLAALGMAVLSFFIGRKIFIKRKWLTAVYIAATLGLALFVFRNYCLSMWWN